MNCTKIRFGPNVLVPFNELGLLGMMHQYFEVAGRQSPADNRLLRALSADTWPLTTGDCTEEL